MAEVPGPSDEFIDALVHTQSQSILCQFCGTTYYCVDDGTIEEGYVERMRADAAAKPGKFIEVSGFTRWGHLEGMQWVIECRHRDDCPGRRKAIQVEQWVWRHRHFLFSYFRGLFDKKRSQLDSEERQFEEVEQDKELL